MSIINERFDQGKLLRRFGNITTTATAEVLVSARTYVEQGSEAQRSVKSTSASDGSSKQVRIWYLGSNYALAFEDLVLNGTTAVATVATNIRFVESFELVEGVAAVGAIELWSNNSGGGTAICGIGAGTSQAFLCHHYVPANKQAWLANWGATATREINLKLLGQDRQNGVNLVDRVLDLENLRSAAVASDSTLRFDRDLGAVCLPEKTYVRISVVPLSTTSTVTRAWFYVWEESII
jgi:hypothetical protein